MPIETLHNISIHHKIISLFLKSIRTHHHTSRTLVTLPLQHLALTWYIHAFLAFGWEDTAVVAGLLCVKVGFLVYLGVDCEVVIAPGIEIVRRSGYEWGHPGFGIWSADQFLIWRYVVWAVLERDCIVTESLLCGREAYFIEVWVTGGIELPHEFI
jgi:hypothetical protein